MNVASRATNRRTSLALLLAAGIVAPTQLQGASQEPAFVADPAHAPVVAIGTVPASAWLVNAGAVHRVAATAPPEAPPTVIGPRGPGDDGAPAMAALGGSIWVVAARRDASASRLWAQRWRAGSWEPAAWLPTADRFDHHPALAARGRTLWAVWIGGDDVAAGTLYAARWRRGSWSAPEGLPAAPGPPMAPSVVVDRNGRPVVTWAASDGEDAEIWVSLRRDGEWSPPEQISDNDVPDVGPRIAAGGRATTVAWTSFRDDAYRPVVRRGLPGSGRWGATEIVAAEPGAAPRIVDDATSVIWAGVTPSGGNQLRIARRGAGGWSEPADLVQVDNARFGAAVSAGRAVLAWRADDRTVVAEGADLGVRGGRHRGIELASLTGDGAVAASGVLALTLPGTYLAFGDSITEGIVKKGEERVTTEGYRAPLEELVEELTGKRSARVVNAGLAGEMTTEGLNRLQILLNAGARDFTLVMEGTNDIVNIVDDATILFNLRQMIEEIQEAGSIPVISTVPARADIGVGFGGALNEKIDRINDQLRPSIRSRDALLADQHDALDGKVHLYSDNLHPNEDGYVVVARTWFEPIQPILAALLRQQDTTEDFERNAALKPPDKPADIDQHKLVGCC